MRQLRFVLMALFTAIFAYTVYTVSVYGWTLIPIFLGDLFSGTWRGQFNLDFLTYLWLSALWIAWRGGFTGGAIAIALAASVLGMIFFAPYVLYLTAQSGGDMRKLLLGMHAEKV